MGVNISYMGTKRALAPVICNVIRQGQKGAMLDAFAGMCSVGEYVAPTRQVWSNDVQFFASETARALFTSQEEPLDGARAADILFDYFDSHRRLLTKAFHKSLAGEDALLESPNFASFSKRNEYLSRIYKTEWDAVRRHRGNLFALTYANSYFGIRQAIEADSIIAAVRTAFRKGAISSDHQRWFIVGLGRMLLKISNTTGHFAQFLKPRKPTYQRYISQRKRSLWTEWLFASGEHGGIGTKDWRIHNRVFTEDSLILLPRLKDSADRPAVVYADPPYKYDQYSRFYHILETLILYDYPAVSGNGLYRPNRFSSPFSLRSKVGEAFDSLIRAAAKIGADMVLSYPTNGLIYDIGLEPKKCLSKHFRKVECCYSIPYTHSTFGASHGVARSKVTERIYLAKS